MDRFTISLSPELATAFDALIAERGYASRSEAVRDILRREVQASRSGDDARGHCVASLSYVYDHHERSLAERLTELQHGHHELTVATMHAHLDHDNCLEAVLLKGPVRDVRRFADALIAERGVRNGHLNLVDVEPDAAHRVHGGHDHHHDHDHDHDHDDHDHGHDDPGPSHPGRGPAGAAHRHAKD
jgi:CopG family transcriptional regulator, nickel-responsive regulator